MDRQTDAIVNSLASTILPEKLWRVQYGDGTLQARGSPRFANRQEFRSAAENHLDWHSNALSPFISTFSDQNHTVNWAKKTALKYSESKIHEINTAALGPVFCVTSLMKWLKARPPIPEDMYKDEYFVLSTIPQASIVNTTLSSQLIKPIRQDKAIMFYRGKAKGKLLEFRSSPNSDANITYVWVPNHYDGDDSDSDDDDSDSEYYFGRDDYDEVAERNTEDDIIKMVEILRF